MSFFEVNLSLFSTNIFLNPVLHNLWRKRHLFTIRYRNGKFKKNIQAFSKKNKTERRLHLINHFGSPKGTYYKPKFYFSQVEENFMAVKHCQTCLTVYGSFGLKNNGLFQLPYIQNCLCILLALFWLPKFKETRYYYRTLI